MHVMKYILTAFYILIITFLINRTVSAQNINRPNIHAPGNVEVNSYTGNMFMERNDLFIKNRKFNLDITFNYNSNAYNKNYGYGNGWGFHYLMKYLTDSNGVTIVYADGRRVLFEGDTTLSGPFTPETGTFDSLSQYQPNKFVLVTKGKLKYFFDNSQHRRLTRMEERNGNFLNFTYTDSLLTLIADAAGRTIQLSYTAGKLTQVTDANGSPRTVNYSYDAAGNLTKVTDPVGNETRYQYLVNGPMSEVTDKNNNGVNIIYHSNFAVKEIISCITNQRFSYNTDSRTTHLVETVESGNQVTYYKYDENGYLVKKNGNCCGYNVEMGYDQNGNMVSYTNANGNTLQYTYDPKGNLLSTTDPVGNTSYYTYESSFNKLATYKNRNGNINSYTYDNKGNLIQVVFPLGISNSYTYNSAGDLTATTDGNGNTTSYDYDNYGNVTAIHKPLGVNVLLGYDTKSRLTSFTDPRGNVTTVVYDALDRMTAITDANGNSFVMTYDANGNMLTMKDRKNNITTYGYDALDRLILLTNALNQNTSIVYDARSNVLSVTDANGITNKNTYDHLNRLMTSMNGNNELTQYSYDGRGNITGLNLPNGNTVSMTYDKLNQLIQVSDNIGEYYSYSYDNIGNLLSAKDANGNATDFTYDALSRKITSSDALGYSSLISYDNNFNVTTITDKSGKVRTFTYDALNRRTGSKSALNFITSFAYDVAGNLTSVTDANGHATSYVYDNLNRHNLITYADGTTNSLAYDANGNVISLIDAAGATTEYVYDALNRLTIKNYPGSNDDVFSYDPAGRLISAVNSDATVTFAYDAANRMISETLNGRTTGYTYDVAGNKSTIHYPGGRSIERSMDQRGRLTSVKEGTVELTNFVYDDADRLITKSYPVNGTETNYTYDSNDRITSMISSPGNFLKSVFTYDVNGNKLTENKLHRPDQSEQYAYDDDYRLTSFKRGVMSGNSIPSPSQQINYNYDPLGNRTTVVENSQTTTYATNVMNGYTSINGQSTISLQYDSKGNIINDGTFTNTYDTQNRLINVNGGAVATYKYDALGRRIQKNVGGTITSFAYSGIHEIENLDATNTVTSSYVYGGGFDNILSAELNGADYFYNRNGIGSVNAITSSNGTVLERYEYDAFGSEQLFDGNYNALATSGIGNHILYTGRTKDSEIDKYYYRARHYSDYNGRFEQRDPLQYFAGDMNLYAYVFNAPTRFTDLRGTKVDCGSPRGNKSGGEAVSDFVGDVTSPVDFGSDVAGKLSDGLNDYNTKSIQSNIEKLRTFSDTEEELDILEHQYAQRSSTLNKISKTADKVGKVAGALGFINDLYELSNEQSLGNITDVGFDLFGYSPAAPVTGAFELGFNIGSIISSGELKSLGDVLDEVDWDYAFGIDSCD